MILEGGVHPKNYHNYQDTHNLIFQAQIFHENLEVPKAQQILELSAFTKVIAQRS